MLTWARRDLFCLRAPVETQTEYYMPQSVHGSCIRHHHSTFIDAQAKRLDLTAGLLLFCMTWHGHSTDYHICMRPGAGSDFWTGLCVRCNCWFLLGHGRLMPHSSQHDWDIWLEAFLGLLELCGRDCADDVYKGYCR